MSISADEAQETPLFSMRVKIQNSHKSEQHPRPPPPTPLHLGTPLIPPSDQSLLLPNNSIDQMH